MTQNHGKEKAEGVRVTDKSVNADLVEATKNVYGRYISRNEKNLLILLQRHCPDVTIDDLLQAGTIRQILDGPVPTERHYQRNVF